MNKQHWDNAERIVAIITSPVGYIFRLIRRAFEGKR
jgi:hypothetical protein